MLFDGHHSMFTVAQQSVGTRQKYRAKNQFRSKKMTIEFFLTSKYDWKSLECGISRPTGWMIEPASAL